MSMDNPVNRPSGASTAGTSARQPQASAPVRAAIIDTLPRQQLIKARVVAVELAAASLQLSRSRAQGALLQLTLDVSNRPSATPDKTSAGRPASLLATISATDLAAALKSPGQAPLPVPQTNAKGGLAAGDKVLFDQLSRALLRSNGLGLQSDGQRLNLLGRIDSASASQASTAESIARSLGKWMPLQGSSADSLKALTGLAAELRNGVAAGGLPPGAARLSAALDKMPLQTLANLQKPGALKQHMTDSGMLMEARTAMALRAGSTQPSTPAENASLTISSATGTRTRSEATPTLSAVLKSLVNRLQPGTSRPASDGPALTNRLSPAGQIGLPQNDLKAAVLEALGLALRLHSSSQKAASSSVSSAVSGPNVPSTPAELVRLIRSALLTAGTGDPIAGSIATMQSGAAYMPAALANSSALKQRMDTGEVLKHLSRLLASIHSNQLSSTMTATAAGGDPAASQTLMLDLPFMHGQPEMVAVTLERFEHEGTGTENEDRTPGYRIVLDFNFDSSQRISELHSHIRYTDGTVSATFWTPSPTEAAIVDSHLQDLRAALSGWGLQVGELSLRVGKPPARRQGVTRQLLDERI